MTNIVNSGSTLTLVNSTGFTLTSDGTVPVNALLDGAGTIIGSGFTLLVQGTVSADVSGVALSIDTGTLVNQGSIVATNGSLIIQSSVTTTNLSGTVLTGGVWGASGTGTLDVARAQIVTDNATITLNGSASVFESGQGTPLTIENSLATIGAAGVLNILGGRDFDATNALIVNGTVTLGGGTLSVPSGITIGATGDVAGFGTIDPGTPIVDAGTIEAKGGTLSLPGAGSVSGVGTLQVDAGASLALQAFGTYAQSVANNGTIDATFGGLTGTLGFSGAYSGTGGFLIQGGFDAADRSVLELPAGLSANIAFDANFGELLLDAPSTFNGTVSGFGNSDTLVLDNIGNAAHATLTGFDLNITNASSTVVQTVTLDSGSMNYGGASFIVSENTITSKATVTVTGVTAAACFGAGTRIRTVDGEVNVERLTVGAVLHTHFNGTAPVVWLGHRHVDCRRHPEPSQVWPVLVSAHAFGPRIPERDLWLSPDHAVYVDGMLIPIKYLINRKTIVQRKVNAITYYHVELGEHDVLLAEGMQAESYLENGNRQAFDNASGLISLYPDFSKRRWDALGCAPFVVTGPKLDAVAARLRARMPKHRPVGRTSRWVAGSFRSLDAA
jgi:collagen type I/II/III/V/XI/XXIV/XXVII alpha